MADAKDTGAKPTLLSNIIALIGFFFLLILIIWGLMNITSWMPGLFSFFSRPSSTLTITAAQGTIPSGEPTTIGWTHNAKSGSYAFAYDCVANGRIQVTQADGTNAILPCATAYAVNADGPKAIRVVPLADAASVSIPFTITYRDESGVAGASDAATLAVQRTAAGNGGATTTPPVSTPGTGGSDVPRIPDLAIRVLGTGVLVNGQFIPRTQWSSNEVVSIRFEIRNAGTGATGPWSFSANLPSSTNPSYASAVQQSMGPGDRIEYTLSFDGMYQNGGLLTITADPAGAVRESSEANNTLSYQLTMSGGFQQTQYQQQNYQYGY